MKCENCNCEHDGKYASGRFCCLKCARGSSTKAKRQEINARVSITLKGRKLTEEHKKNLERANNFNRKEKIKKTCPNCNKDFLCRPSDRRKFCIESCKLKHYIDNANPKMLYRQQCKFDFDVRTYPNKFDLTLLKTYGWYRPSNRGNNLSGISRDHRLSVLDGYILGISPELMKHPANCQLLLHTKNQQKNRKSSITYEQLLRDIHNW